MNIKGIHKTSLIDYPGRICSIVFTGGCNLRCRYCHNPELACNSPELQTLSNTEALNYIDKRKKIIDGISISGGEPTISKNIDDFIKSVKSLSLSVKLDTNGLNPEVIERLYTQNLLDYVAIDIKTSPEKYSLLTNKIIDFSKIKRTLDIVKSSGIDYEIRTTCIPYYVELGDFISIKREIGNVSRYFIQQFVNDVTLDSELASLEPYPESELKKFKKFVESFSDVCEIRGI